MMIREPSSTPRILLVDDEIQQLWLRAQVMQLLGFPVLTADNPSDAIFIMAEETIDRIDLVILDYEMPGMNGCDLADLLKVMRPELKIILYSGATDVPRNEMTSIDTFVSKADGITALIAEVAELTQVGGGSATAITRNSEQLYRVDIQQR
jgi:DNA-binding NtrC family response regulator